MEWFVSSSCYSQEQVYVDGCQLKFETLIKLLNQFREVKGKLEENHSTMSNREKEYRSRHRDTGSSPKRKKQRTRKEISFEDDSHLVPKPKPIGDNNITEHGVIMEQGDAPASPFEKLLGYQMT